MTRFAAPQKVLQRQGSGKSAPAMLTAVLQQCGMTENKQGFEPS